MSDTKHTTTMKRILTAAAALVLTATAVKAEETVYIIRRDNSVNSMQRRGFGNGVHIPTPSAPAVTVKMSEVDPASARFGRIFAQVKTTQTKLDVDTFLIRLRGGEVFVTKVTMAPQRCEPCYGWGKIHNPKSARSDRKDPCTHCAGKGKLPAERLCRILWN